MPNEPESLLQAIHAAAVGGDLDRAITLADEAGARGIEHPLVLNLLALRHDREGRPADALPLLQRAVALAPDDAGSVNALGLNLLAQERAEEALGCFDRVCTLAPGASFAHANRAAALRALGDLAGADRSYAQALGLDPRHPLALSGRATIAGMRGDAEKARTLALAALAVTPAQPEAVLGLAAAELALGDGASALRRAEDLLKEARLGPLDRADAHGLAGDALDRLGDYRRAFEAYGRRNELLRAWYRPRFGTGPSALAYLQRLRATLAGMADVRWARPDESDGDPQPTFLVGFPRSGTTLLEVVLDGHPGIATLDEQEFLLDGVRRYLRDPEDLRPLAEASDDELEPLRQNYWAAVRARGIDPATSRVVDKYPLNLLKLPLIARLFPRARILLARRDPRDVVFGCFRRRFRMSAPMYELLTLDGAARFYAEVMAFTDDLLPRLGLATQVVRHEAVVADLPGEVGRVCAFLGVAWTEEMADFGPRSRRRPSATPSTAQLAGGLDRSGLGHWRRYAPELSAVEPWLAPAIARYGYPAD